MDRALVQHAEDEVDRDQRGEDKEGGAAERTLERLRAARKAGGDRRRQVKIVRGLLYRRHRGADGAVGSFGLASVTSVPGCRRYWPRTTTVSPALNPSSISASRLSDWLTETE